MNFKLGKKYIVDVTERGIIPLMEFDNSKWYNKDYDELDFLTDKEKIVVINEVLNKIRAEIEHIGKATPLIGTNTVIEIIDKHIGK